MNNSVLFFRLYLSSILIILLVFSFILSKQLFIIFIKNIKLMVLFNHFKQNFCFNEHNYFNILILYLFNDSLFIPIALSEFILEINAKLISKDTIYASLAYLYYQNSFYSISEYYYFKILYVSPSDKQAILNLGNIYNNLGYKTKANLMLNHARKLTIKGNSNF